MSERYARQVRLEGIGRAGQARLAQARVLVVGAGGLGSYILPALAGAGVGKLVVVDHDVVELSNLHRQPLFRMDDLGRSKAAAAALAITAFNNEIELVHRAVALTPANAAEWVSDVDLVVDAADSLAVTYILSDACQAQGRVLVSASVLEEHGYVGAFNGGAPSYRAVFPEMPTIIGSCALNGVFGTAVGVLGTLQAHIVLQLLLAHDPSPLGRLVSVDLKTYRFGGFTFLGIAESGTPNIAFVTLSDLEPEDLVIELRDFEEAPHAISPKAIRMTPADLASQSLPRDRRLVLCCRSGIRAFKVATALHRNGYERLAALAAIMC